MDMVLMNESIKIAGLQKMSLLDFPGKICATVFLDGCNLRCPFCHNASLVLPQRESGSLGSKEFFEFLSRRTGLLDGVCVTGGEPLLQKNVEIFIADIKDMGFEVKLDTNGTFPDKLEKLIDGGLVDYVAMDIKNSLEKYPATVGIPSFDTAPIEKSAVLLMRGKVPFEFRTTLVREFHEIDDITSIGNWLSGAPEYYLQEFKDSGDLISEGLHGFTGDEMKLFEREAVKFFKKAAIRGI